MRLVHLSEKLRLIFASSRLTQQQVGEAIGIAHTTVGRWLSGKSRPYDRTAQQLAQFLGVDADLLLDDSQPLPQAILKPSGPADLVVAKPNEKVIPSVGITNPSTTLQHRRALAKPPPSLRMDIMSDAHGGGEEEEAGPDLATLLNETGQALSRMSLAAAKGEVGPEAAATVLEEALERVRERVAR